MLVARELRGRRDERRAADRRGDTEPQGIGNRPVVARVRRVRAVDVGQRCRQDQRDPGAGRPGRQRAGGGAAGQPGGGGRPTGPMVRRASTRPDADTNATVAAAWLCAVPPSRADNRYRVPAGTGRPAAERSGTSCRSRTVPPAPPTNISRRAGPASARWPAGSAWCRTGPRSAGRWTPQPGIVRRPSPARSTRRSARPGWPAGWRRAGPPAQTCSLIRPPRAARPPAGAPAAARPAAGRPAPGEPTARAAAQHSECSEQAYRTTSENCGHRGFLPGRRPADSGSSPIILILFDRSVSIIAWGIPGSRACQPDDAGRNRPPEPHIGDVWRELPMNVHLNGPG